MPDDLFPETEANGAPVSSPRTPSTAVSTAPPLLPRRSDVTAPTPWLDLRRLLDAALDGLDAVGDRVAAAVGLR